MKRKKFFPLVACSLLSLPFLTQAVHAAPPKRAPLAKSSSTTSTDPQPITIAGGINVQSEGQCPEYFLNAEEINGQTRCEDPIFFRSNMKISGNEQNHPKLYLKWLTISQADVTFENLDIEGKIQVTAKSKITFKNCTINGTPVDNSMPKNECGVEIFANSSGVFENSILQGGSKTCVAVRDRSHATFSDCTISNPNNTGILIIDKSENIKITRCKFLNCPKFAVYLYKNSTADIDECEFQDPAEFKGKAIFALTGCKATVNKSKFIGCKNGAIACADSSNMKVTECNFNDIGSSAVHGMKNSQICVSDCNFKNIEGNGVNYDNSGGMTLNCNFDTINFPAIAIFEKNGNPKISNCVITGDPRLFPIVIRNGAEPILEDITFKKFTSKHPLISCSDFAKPTITNLKFEDSNELPRIMVYNGAVIKDKSMSNRKTIFLNYNEDTQYHSIFDNGDFMKQFDSSKCIVVEKKTDGKFSISGDFDVNACKGFTIRPSMLPLKSENANTNATKINERFVYSNCAHTANICPDCGKMCKIDIFGDQFRRVCDTCNSEFLSATYFCPLCETPNQKLSKVFEVDKCLICLENPATCIALPCGHKSVCDECSHDCIQNKKQCVTCRSKILCFRHDFFGNNE